MNETLEQLLDQKIPREVVSLRDGGGGRKLSYLEGYYVIDRLNKIFGNTGWSKEITDVRQIVNTTNKGEFPAYLVKVRLTVVGTNGLIVKEGYGYGCDKSTLNAHELAMKEAVTDALKVAAKDLGMSMGLALYDKTQEYVDDGEPEEPSSERTSRKPSSSEREKVVEAAASQTEAKEQSSDKLRSYIQTAVKVSLKKGKSIDEIKAHLSSAFGVTALADLPDSKLPEFKKYIDSLI